MKAAPERDRAGGRRRASPEVAALVALGAALLAVAEAGPWLPAPLVALALGAVLGRRTGVFTRSHGRPLLQVGIVLLGLRLSLGQLAEVGGAAVAVIVPSVVVGAGAAYVAAAVAGLGHRARLLLAAGTAICGNSAIATVAPAIDARDDETAVAAATITIYGTGALLLFPLVAGVLDLSAETAGTWLAVAINDTSQVLAASFSLSAATGATATIVKLARNLFIVPAALIAPMLVRRDAAERVPLHRQFPWFIVAFGAAVALATSVSLPGGIVDLAGTSSRVFVYGGLVAVGASAARLRLDRRALLPLAAGSVAGIVLAAVSLLLVTSVT